MGPPRTAAGHAAAKLKVALMSKLGNGTEDDAVLRAANLCDRFLNSCNNTDAGLEVLKDEVKKILSGQDAKTKKMNRKSSVPMVTGIAVHDTQATMFGGDRASKNDGGKQAAAPPWMLPHIRMAPKAHVSTSNPFHKIAHNVAAIEETDDVIRNRNKTDRMTKTRAMLDKQMEEVNANKRAEAEKRWRDKEESDRKIREHWKLSEEERIASLNHALTIKGEREAQVSLMRKAHEEEKTRLAKEAAVERAELEEQKLRDLAEKKAEKKRQDAALAKAATENLERQRMRAEARVKDQEENQRIALLQIKMREEAEAKREAEQEAMREKILAKYRAAGGEAREADLIAKSRADAEKAAREAAEYERKQDEDLRRRKMEKEERNALQVRTLDYQMGLLAEQKRQEAVDKRQHGEELRVQSAERKAREKSEKMQAKVAGKAEIQRRLKEIEDEKKKLYMELTEQLDHKQEGIHIKVVEGTAKPFHYFKAQNPGT